LDATHVFSHTASFGRTKLMGVAIKRFLAQVKRHAPESYGALPEAFRLRYQAPHSQLFAGAKDAEADQRSRKQAAQDLHCFTQCLLSATSLMTYPHDAITRRRTVSKLVFAPLPSSIKISAHFFRREPPEGQLIPGARFHER